MFILFNVSLSEWGLSMQLTTIEILVSDLNENHIFGGTNITL